MKDKNGVEIKVGDLVKRYGLVQYADGLKGKISKKTWRVSKIEGDQLFYLDENGNDTLLPLPKQEGAFLVVSPAELTPVVGINPGGVPLKYRVHGDNETQNWKDGDIVQIFGNVSKETIDAGTLERVPDTLEHKHVLVVADPLKVFGNSN